MGLFSTEITSAQCFKNNTINLCNFQVRSFAISPEDLKGGFEVFLETCFIKKKKKYFETFF